MTLTTGAGSLSGCSPSTAAGVTTYTGCAIDTANAGDVLTATTTQGVLLSTTSVAFDVTVGAPAQLVFTTQPAGAIAGSAFARQPIVTIEDAGGNTVTIDTNTVTMAMGSGPGTLSGCTSTTTGGVTDYSGCSINAVGEHVISATDSSDALNNISVQFDVTPS